jgi:hypothetical protein
VKLCAYLKSWDESEESIETMRLFIGFLLWCGLLALCWPIALLALVLFPIVWLLCLPFRILGIVVGAMLSLVKTLLYLPARILGHRSDGG